MTEQLSPAERDHAPGSQPSSLESAPRPSRGQNWLWIVVGIVVLLSLGAGAIAGYIVGRVHERDYQTVVVVPPPPVVTPSDLPEGFFLVEGGLAFVYPPDFYAFSDAYPFLGVALEDRRDGVFLSDVFEDSPADMAGLQRGDRIIAVDSQLTNTPNDLQELLAGYAPGEMINITIERSRALQDVYLTLGGYIPFEGSSGGYDVQLPPPVPLPPQSDAYLGGRYQMVSTEDGFAVSGALVIEVQAGSPADSAGLEPGSIIVSVDGVSVSDYASLEALIQQHSPGDTVTLQVWRDGSIQRMRVQLGG